jgi:hypothetical protein
VCGFYGIELKHGHQNQTTIALRMSIDYSVDVHQVDDAGGVEAIMDGPHPLL